MKNKILKKILLVVVCVSVLVVSLVVPSFAYTQETFSPANNATSENPLYIPSSNIRLVPRSVVNSSGVFSDFPSYINYPFINSMAISNSPRTVATYASEFDGYDLVYSPGFLTLRSNVYQNTGFVQLNEYGVASTSSYLRNMSYSLYDIVVQFNMSRSRLDLVTNNINSSTFISVDPSYTLGEVVYYNYYITYISDEGEYIEEMYTIETSIVSYTDSLISKGVYLYYLPEELDITNVSWIFDISFNNLVRNVSQPDGSVSTTPIIVSAPTNYFATSNSVRCYTRLPIRQRADAVADRNSYNEFSGGIADVNYNEGYESGVSVGYNEGYQAGLNDGTQVADVNLFQFIMNAVSAFVNWEFIPGVSIGIILTIIVGVVLILTFLKFFAGG